MNAVVSVMVVAAAIFGFMAVEARRAFRNEREQRARGGIEPPDDVYHFMQVAYPGAFLVMAVEGLWRGGGPLASFLAGLVLFALAKALKWWAIATLRQCWTFRVIVVPGAPLIADGPYRFVRHPNYIAVAGEMASAALMTGALVTGPVALVVFGALMARRIAVESRALSAGDPGGSNKRHSRTEAIGSRIR